MSAASIAERLIPRAWVLGDGASAALLGRLIPTLVAGLAIAAFIAVSLRHLDVVPPVYEDEPWQASTGYKLATKGVFGSDLFALLIHLKLVNYTLTILPIWAIAAAWGVATIWRWLASPSWVGWGRAVLAAGLLTVGGEGTSRIAALDAALPTTTPYYAYIDQVRAHVPAGARILGLHNYWFGLEDFDYRSFVVPISWTEPGTLPRPLVLDEALHRVAPDVVLLDRRMREYFTATAQSDDGRSARFAGWLSRHAGEPRGHVDDPTYGLMEIYRVQH
jgi:hypothetical protein